MNLLFVSIIAFSVLSFATATPNLNDHIAIVGGGVSGLFAARELKLLGYQNVIVFEKDPQVAGVTVTVPADGGFYDTSTKFIPQSTAGGMGIPEPLNSLINQYGLATQVGGPVGFYNKTLPGPMALPHVFAGLTGAQIVGDLVWGFIVLEQIWGKSIVDCYATLAIPPMTFGDWSALVNRPGFTGFAAYLHDLFLGGVAFEQDVCAVLRVRSYFMASDIADVLEASGVPAVPQSPTLTTLIQAGRVARGNSFFTDGYRNFFETMVTQEGLNVCLNSFVSKIRYRNGQQNYKIWINGQPQSQKYDHLIIASRPFDVASAFKPNSPVRDLYDSVFFCPVYTSLVRTQSGAPLFPPGVDTFVLYPQSLLLASATAPVLPFAASYATPDLAVVIGYSQDGLESTADAAIRSEMQSIGRDVTEVLQLDIFPYVSQVTADAVRNGFYAQADALQGHENLYMVGETFSGYGVAIVSDQTIDIIRRFF